VWIVPSLEGGTTTHVRLVDLSSGSEYAIGGTGARPRGDIDDAVFAIREGSGSCVRLAARLHSYALLPSATPWADLGQSVVLRSPMLSTKIGGARLTAICSGLI
jgi:hypothetical protein